MKKAYISPKTIEIKMQTMQMLAGSATLTNNGDYGTGEGITLGSRRGGGSFFDDDDEE